MKIEELLEMPLLKKSELEVRSFRPFYSENSLADRFDFIHKGTTFDDENYWVVIRKNHQFASIGIPGTRYDGVDGMRPIGTVEFKPPVLSTTKNISLGKNVLQVALAEVSKKYQTMGWGLYLYTALADAGYVVISDNTQYLGGQALWKRIARETLHSRYKVYVIDNGEVRLTPDGKPVEYNGSNIDESGLWSENSDKKYTLFALKEG